MPETKTALSQCRNNYPKTLQNGQFTIRTVLIEMIISHDGNSIIIIWDSHIKFWISVAVKCPNSILRIQRSDCIHVKVHVRCTNLGIGSDACQTTVYINLVVWNCSMTIHHSSLSYSIATKACFTILQWVSSMSHRTVLSYKGKREMAKANLCRIVTNALLDMKILWVMTD